MLFYETTQKKFLKPLRMEKSGKKTMIGMTVINYIDLLIGHQIYKKEI